MSNRPFLIFGALVAVVAVIAFWAFAKEGSNEAVAVPVESADQEAQEMFATNCGTCHTLAAGGTDGVVGPNLDQILPTQVAPATGTAEEVAEANVSSYEGVYGRVLNAITCGLEGRMPAGILQGEDAQDVAGFVAAYAGQLAEDQGPLVPADDRSTPAAQACAGGETQAQAESSGAGQGQSESSGQQKQGQSESAGAGQGKSSKSDKQGQGKPSKGDKQGQKKSQQ